MVKEKIKEEIKEKCEEGSKNCPKIDSLSLDLGRGDLNLMMDKINEIVNKLNGN